MSSQLARLPQDTYEKKRLTKTLDGNSGQQLNRSRKLRGGRKIRAVLDFYFFEILNGYLRNAGKSSPSCAKFSISLITNCAKERRKP